MQVRNSLPQYILYSLGYRVAFVQISLIEDDSRPGSRPHRASDSLFTPFLQRATPINEFIVPFIQKICRAAFDVIGQIEHEGIETLKVVARVVLC